MDALLEEEESLRADAERLAANPQAQLGYPRNREVVARDDQVKALLLNQTLIPSTGLPLLDELRRIYRYV